MSQTIEYGLFHGETCFMHDDEFGMAGFGGRFAKVFRGSIETEGETPESWANLVFHKHNVDDRPRRMSIRSMSVGDVVVLRPVDDDTDFSLDSVGLGDYVVDEQTSVLRCDSHGWKTIQPESWLAARHQSQTEMERRHDTFFVDGRIQEDAKERLFTSDAALQYED